MKSSLSTEMLTLNIAGTSSGGSSYAHRLLKAFNEATTKNPVLVVNITAGAKQESVFNSVNNSINELEKFLAVRGAKSTVLRVRVNML